MSEKKLNYHCYFDAHRRCHDCACWCHRAVIHELKTWPEYYRDIAEGAKAFEVRKDDRGFEVGHILNLREYEPKAESYTGHESYYRVAYILRGGAFGIENGYCVMGLALPPLMDR